MPKSGFSSLQNPAPLKMVICVRRQPTMTLPQFLNYWLKNHAPLALKAYERGHAPPMLGYIQNHTLPHSAVDQCAIDSGFPQRSYDGLTEVWLDKIEDLDMSAQVSQALANTNEILIADEASFVSLPDSRVFSVQCNATWIKPKPPNNAIKLVLLIRRSSEPTAWPAQRQQEAKALSQWLKTDPSACGFSQSHAVHSDLMDAFREMRGMTKPPYDDLLELWCDLENIDASISAICKRLLQLYPDNALNYSDSHLYLTQPYRIF